MLLIATNWSRFSTWEFYLAARNLSSASHVPRSSERTLKGLSEFFGYNLRIFVLRNHSSEIFSNLFFEIIYGLDHFRLITWAFDNFLLTVCYFIRSRRRTRKLLMSKLSFPLSGQDNALLSLLIDYAFNVISMLVFWVNPSLSMGQSLDSSN